MTINNKDTSNEKKDQKKKKPEDFITGISSDEKEKKLKKGPGVADTKDDGQGIDIIYSSDYKLNSVGKKQRANRMVFGSNISDTDPRKRKSKSHSIATSDYKLDKDGKKYKPNKIVFNKGTDDYKKGVSEQMKKSYKVFVEQNTLDLNEEELLQLEEELNEVLGKNADASDWIRDFVHSDNSKFKGKSKEQRKQMALGAYYGKQNEEAVEEGYFSDLEVRQQDARAKAKKTAPFSPNTKSSFKKNNPNRTGIDTARSLAQRGLANAIANAKSVPFSPNTKSSFKKNNPNRTGIDTARSLAQRGLADAIANAKSAKSVKEESDFDESFVGTDPITGKILPGTTRKSKTGSGTITHTASGVKHERDYDRLDKETEAQVAAGKTAAGIQKRGRGRPKKDKFAEAFEFLITLEEAEFEHYTQHGFDVFFEAFYNTSDDSGK